MTDNTKTTTFALTLLLAIVLQVLFVFADQVETPGRTAIKFAKAYYLQDPSMRDLLCADVKENEENDLVDDYLHRASEEAERRGLDASYMRSLLLHIETHTVFKDEQTADVRITGARKRQINPVFAWVARIFLIGNTYEVDDTVHLTKESGQWKVCEKELSLPRI
ncbi:MAG: hypothetical protein A2V65_00790 [Deltaproteobacteria bacterium RBG_13_49_15]|nr:MAG: hypothetical protein A2V65_00790 [Deltaproteobacteria bacterium RBG_13_49_15]